MPKNVILDSGFWFALYDERDEHHNAAQDFAKFLHIHSLLIPWPSLYETLNTRFVRRQKWLISFSSLLKGNNIKRLPDVKYREQCLESLLNPLPQKRIFSLVDLIIRGIIQDMSIRIDSVATFNIKDFADVCKKRRVEILMVDYL